MRHKLTTFILKNPPDQDMQNNVTPSKGNKGSKGKKDKVELSCSCILLHVNTFFSQLFSVYVSCSTMLTILLKVCVYICVCMSVPSFWHFCNMGRAFYVGLNSFLCYDCVVS